MNSSRSEQDTQHNLTPAELSARWCGQISEGTLSTWRSEGKGPRFFRPSGKKHGKVLYRLVDVEAWEKEQMEGGKG